MLSVVAALSSLSQSFFLFEAKFDFWGFECKLYGPLKNAPIPQEVKGMADGDSLRQPFFRQNPDNLFDFLLGSDIFIASFHVGRSVSDPYF